MAAPAPTQDAGARLVDGQPAVDRCPSTTRRGRHCGDPPHWYATMSVSSMVTITAVLSVSARAASRANHRNTQIVAGSSTSWSPDMTQRRAIHPAMFANIDGSRSAQSARVRLREVRPPHEYASRCRPWASRVRKKPATRSPATRVGARSPSRDSGLVPPTPCTRISVSPSSATGSGTRPADPTSSAIAASSRGHRAVPAHPDGTASSLVRRVAGLSSRYRRASSAAELRRHPQLVAHRGASVPQRLGGRSQSVGTPATATGERACRRRPYGESDSTSQRSGSSAAPRRPGRGRCRRPAATPRSPPVTAGRDGPRPCASARSAHAGGPRRAGSRSRGRGPGPAGCPAGRRRPARRPRCRCRPAPGCRTPADRPTDRATPRR